MTPNRTTTRIALGLAAALTAAVAVLLGGVLRTSSDGVAAPAVAQPEALQQGFSSGDTAGLIRTYQAALHTDPKNAKGWDYLGLAYQQRARETGDPAYYGKSEQALLRALALDPKNLYATSGLGSLALSRHRFHEALALGRRAQAISPTTARNYGVVGDALVELGRYREAFAAFNTMNRIKPGLSAYARYSYSRELIGDRAGAHKWMAFALDTATGQPEPLAWAHTQLGKFAWSGGNVAGAAREYRAALTAFPGYVYALDAMAQVEAARGHYRRAIAEEQRAVDAIPLPQFLATLGDLYRVTGHPQLARDQYATIGVIERLFRANGVKLDLETALFDVDHGIDLPHVVALARLGHRERPSIDGDDVLAWALERTGHCGEAQRFSKRALRLGTLDALKMFHRGMIERCLGNRAAGDAWLRRALALNPHFSLLWAPVARKALA